MKGGVAHITGTITVDGAAKPVCVATTSCGNFLTARLDHPDEATCDRDDLPPQRCANVP